MGKRKCVCALIKIKIITIFKKRKIKIQISYIFYILVRCFKSMGSVRDIAFFLT